MPKTHIKICGLKNTKDVQFCLDLGIDYLGFNFILQSPRHTNLLDFVKIYSDLTFSVDSKTEFVAILSNPENDFLTQLAQTPIKIWQLHGSETPQRCLEIAQKYDKIIWKALSGQNLNLANLKDYDKKVSKIILDMPKNSQMTAPTKAFDNLEIFKKAQNIFGSRSVILAGGVNESNLEFYLKELKPSIIDIASGAEESPGIKSWQKIENIKDIIETFPNFETQIEK